MGKLEGKIALITGGNSGIGLATAKQFVNEGAYVFITGRRDPELAAEVKEIGRHVTGVQGDVSNLGDLDRLFAQIKREKGTLDSVFANAGIATYAPFGEITEEHYDAIFNINVKGLLFTVQKALPLLPDGASIILNASIVASKGLPANSVYSATKAAVRSFARTWTTDLRDRRIRVNAVSPGYTDTPPWHSVEAAEERMKTIYNSVPLGRFGTPDEIAKAVVFLASDDSSYITEMELFVDGGFAQVWAVHSGGARHQQLFLRSALPCAVSLELTEKNVPQEGGCVCGSCNSSLTANLQMSSHFTRSPNRLLARRMFSSRWKRRRSIHRTFCSSVASTTSDRPSHSR
jgi:NAD(P)-dependent dehydrogenase (short-subunit alcohol dehydrogenase family)